MIDSAAWRGQPEAIVAWRIPCAGAAVVGDLAWTRLTRWREMMRAIFENREYAWRILRSHQP